LLQDAIHKILYKCGCGEIAYAVKDGTVGYLGKRVKKPKRPFPMWLEGRVRVEKYREWGLIRQ
jgi:hypothetical protein